MDINRDVSGAKVVDSLRPALARILIPAAKVLALTPVTPNALTIIGTIGVSASSLILFPIGHLLAGAIVCAIFSLADLLDGALARVKGKVTTFGAFLDPTLDRVADAAIFIALAAWSISGGNDRTLAVLTMYCLASTVVISFAKARAEALGLRCDNGLAGRAARLIVIFGAAGLAGLGVPHTLDIGFALLAAANSITVWQRIRSAYKAANATEKRADRLELNYQPA